MVKNERKGGMPEISKLARCTVGKGRRITLPAITEDLNEFDQLVFTKVDGGYLVKKVPTQEVSRKKLLFAVEIGQSAGNGRWYGIVTDRMGIIKFRKSSSTRHYLKKDLSELTDQRMRDRLNEKCGIGQWDHPIFLDLGGSLVGPPEVMKVAQECRKGLVDGTWPPTKPIQDADYDY